MRLSLLRQSVSVRCDAADIEPVLRVTYGTWFPQSNTSRSPPDLAYRIAESSDGELILFRGDEPVTASTPREHMSFLFDDDLILQLQRLRADLLFVHAAVLQHRRGAILLVGESGAGKSTLAWTLAQSGLCYLSDELAPIEVIPRRVRPFPRAICLKTAPPEPYVLPPQTARSGELIYVPPATLPGGVGVEPCPLDALVFLGRSTGPAAARPIGAGEATARLYAQTLNALAHPGDGLDAAIAICEGSRCFAVDVGAVEETAALVSATLA